MPHYQGSSWLGHGSDVGLPPRPTYGGVSPLMQQLIGETPEGAGLGLGVEPSWMGLGGADAPDPRMTQQRQETGFPTRPVSTSVDDIVDALRAKQISRAQAQAYLERLMAPDVARAFLDRNFAAEIEETVTGSTAPIWNTPSEVYAAVRADRTLYWEGVEALVGMGKDRGGSMDYLGTLYENYLGGGDGGRTLAAQGLDGGGSMPVIPSSDVPVSSYLGYDTSSGRPDPFTRYQALEEQREVDPRRVFGRVTQSIPGFSGFNPFLQRAIQDRYGDARARFNLSQFSSPDTGFEDFLGGGGAWGRGDPGVLKGQLQNLRDYLESGVTSFAGQPALSTPTLRALRGTFANPEEVEQSNRNVLQALLQPGLATVAPSLRGAFASATGQEFDRFLASNPETGVLGEFSRRGFF